MADYSLHYTPLPEQVTAKSDGSSGGIKGKLPLIIVGFLIIVAAVLGVFYYYNVFSVQTNPAAQKSATTPTPGSDEVNIFSDMEAQSLSCLDWQKYKARLDMIGQVCTAGCCPWTGMDGTGCTAPHDGECKPKGNPCSDGTCWECRFEDERGFVLLRYEGNQWVSCSEEAPTPTPEVKNPIDVCTSPNVCVKPEDCAVPPVSTNPGSGCTNGLYCCKPKVQTTPTATPSSSPSPTRPSSPSPTRAACIKPILNIEVECLQCDGEAITQ